MARDHLDTEGMRLDLSRDGFRVWYKDDVDFPEKPDPIIACIIPVGPFTTERDLAFLWKCISVQKLKPAYVIFAYDGCDFPLPPEITNAQIPVAKIVFPGKPTGRPGYTRNRALQHLIYEIKRGSLLKPFAVFSADPDDYFPPHYLYELTKKMLNNPRAAAVYPELYENWDKKTRYTCLNITRLGIVGDLSRLNWVQGSCLIRFEAVVQIGGWWDKQVIDDWPTFQKMVRNGWHMDICEETEYYWCRSERGLCAVLEHDNHYWFRDAGKHFNQITVALPLMRLDHVEAVKERLRRMKTPQNGYSLIIYDLTGKSDEGRKAFADLLLDKPDWLGDFRYVEDRDKLDLTGRMPNSCILDGSVLNDKTGTIWMRYLGVINRIFSIAETPWIFLIQDDIDFPPNIIEELLVYTVAGPFTEAAVPLIKSRYAENHYVGWNFSQTADGMRTSIKEGSGKRVAVDGVDLECGLFLRSVFSRFPFQVMGEIPNPKFPLLNYWRALRQYSPRGNLRINTELRI